MIKRMKYAVMPKTAENNVEIHLPTQIHDGNFVTMNYCASKAIEIPNTKIPPEFHQLATELLMVEGITNVGIQQRHIELWKFPAAEWIEDGILEKCRGIITRHIFPDETVENVKFVALKGYDFTP
jgi:hypothetical protein